MDAPVDLRTTLGAAPIQRDVVMAQGPDCIDFLQGQLSQDVPKIGMHDSMWSLLLQPTGKVDAWVRVTRSGENQALLDVDAGFGELVLQRLKRFKLRTKVELALERWGGLALRGPGAEEVDEPRGAMRLAARWPGVESVDLLSPDPLALAGVPLVEPAALAALRIECGVPAMGAELTGSTIPAEAGQWLIDASVSFTKGCYTGQELVARIDSRGGNVPRPVRGLRIDGDPIEVGSEVVAGDAVVGSVTSSARSAALGAIALAPINRSVEVGASVTVDGRPAAVAELPLR
jgi:folate-binding protein YgfZ